MVWITGIRQPQDVCTVTQGSRMYSTVNILNHVKALCAQQILNYEAKYPEIQ